MKPPAVVVAKPSRTTDVIWPVLRYGPLGMGNIETGEINSLEHFRRTLSDEEFMRSVIPVEELTPHAREVFEKTGKAKIGRNDPCLCASGRKFKHCCMRLPQPVERPLIVAPW